MRRMISPPAAWALLLTVVAVELGAATAAQLEQRLAAATAAVAQVDARLARLGQRVQALDHGLARLAPGPDVTALEEAITRTINLAPDLSRFDRAEETEDHRWRQAEPEHQARIAKLVANPPDTSELEQVAADLRPQIEALRRERDQVLAELAAGRFCSECGRTASQIERQTKQSFQDHLVRVKGEAVPKSREELRAKREEYDRKIGRLAKRADDAVSKARKIHDDHTAALATAKDDYEHDRRTHFQTLGENERDRREERQRFTAEMRERVDALQAEIAERGRRHQARIRELRAERDRVGSERHRLELRRIGLAGDRQRLAMQLAFQRRWDAEAAAKAAAEEQRQLEREVRRAERERRRAELAARPRPTRVRPPGVWSPPAPSATSPMPDAEEAAAKQRAAEQRATRERRERIQALAAEEAALRQRLAEVERQSLERAQARAELAREQRDPTDPAAAAAADAPLARQPALPAPPDPARQPAVRNAVSGLAAALGVAGPQGLSPEPSLVATLSDELRDRIGTFGDDLLARIDRVPDLAVTRRLGDLLSSVESARTTARSWFERRLARDAYETRTGRDFDQLDAAEQSFERLRVNALRITHPVEYLPRLMDRFETFMGIITPKITEADW